MNCSDFELVAKILDDAALGADMDQGVWSAESIREQACNLRNWLHSKADPPALPKPARKGPWPGDPAYFTESQMRAYGEKCALASTPTPAPPAMGESETLILADLRKIEGCRAAIGGTEEIADMYADYCKQFVHNHADTIRQMCLAASAGALEVPGSTLPESISRSYWATQFPGKMPKLYGAHAIANLNWNPQEGQWLLRLREVERYGDGAPKAFENAATESALLAEVARLTAIIDTPQAGDFLRAVSTEAEHQRRRWGNEHDTGKSPADWYWLVGYLAGKALHAHITGDAVKAEHHMITTAAACENWQRALLGKTDLRPGTSAPEASNG